MIVRIACAGRSTSRVSAEQLRPFASTSARRDTERNIFLEADEDAADQRGRSLLDKQRAKMAQEPVWNGDERVQDTILRMVMDKYQPIRVRGEEGSLGQHPADAKLSSIQKPSMLSSPSFNNPATPSAPSSAAIIDVNKITPHLLPVNEEGRRLAKTPDEKPWAAVYVNPMHREGEGASLMPSIHYGKYLGLPMSGCSRISAKAASGKERLKLAGIKAESLPLDDRNKMRAIREGVRRWDRAGRMRGVKEDAVNYKRMKEEERDRGNRPMTDDEVEAYLQQRVGVLREGEEMKLTSGSSDSKPGEAVIAMSGGRGFTSLANERIEAAMKTDYFQRNNLRGKPLERDVHAMNPFLKGEERIMNRLIQRQGAAPPWVELNSQVETETNEWRARLADNWVRRASRMILSSSHMKRGLESVRTGEFTTFEDLEDVHRSSGQRKLLTLAKIYRDTEWETREKSYHEASLKEINNIIRKYNIVAPTSVRKGLLSREQELQRAFEFARFRLVAHLSEGLSTPATSLPNALSSQAASLSTAKSHARMARPAASAVPIWLSSRAGAGVATGQGEDGSSTDEGPIDSRARQARMGGASSYTFQIASFVRRIKEQLVG